jgi:1,4-dihydroxy-2-naphthoate octaprenyltransferase
MLSSSSWLHLRIPFSYFLLPVYLFTLSVSSNFTESGILWVFIILHFFLYPASNGYNSYFDKDEKSIGGLKNPPPVKKGLYYLALTFDAIAIILAIVKISIPFAIMVLVYGLVSKAYSHPSIRLKKRPIVGWLTIGLFQGLFTFMMCYVGINNYTITQALKSIVLIPGALTSIMLLASYPMTQIFQHEEDGKRRDRTISLVLGIKGTFYFVGLLFGVVSLIFAWYFNNFFSIKYTYAFLISMGPVVVYFFIWFFLTLKDEKFASYKWTMGLNFISSTCLNIFFVYLFINSTQILQVFE